MGAATLRGAVACAVLVWLAAPYWSEQLDDVFITATYAREWSASGEIRWPTGERVEGYSHFLWLLALRAAVDAGLDVGLFAKLASLACGCALLAGVSLLAPWRAAGHLLVLALAAWAPLAYWSAMGMETTLFAGLATFGAAGALAGGARRAAGLWLLAFASLARPEGLLWLAFGAWAGWRAPAPPAARRAGLLALVAVGLYHAWRIAYFGAIVPTPLLVKAQVGTRGFAQLAVELLSAAGPLGCAALATRLPRGERLQVLAPLAISAAVLLSANGDWMAYARLLLPGVVATSLLWTLRGTPRPIGGAAVAAGIALALSCGAIEPRFLQPPALRVPPRSPVEPYARGLDTPLREQVAWLIAHAPDGALVQAADIGFISQIPGLRVLDSRGLTARAFAESRRSGNYDWLARLYAGENRPDIIQVARFVPSGTAEPPAPDGLDPWLSAYDPLLAKHYRHRAGVRAHQRGFLGLTRFHRAELREPTIEQQHARWRILHDRFPSQPWLGERLRATEARLKKRQS